MISQHADCVFLESSFIESFSFIVFQKSEFWHGNVDNRIDLTGGIIYKFMFTNTYAATQTSFYHIFFIESSLQLEEGENGIF